MNQRRLIQRTAGTALAAALGVGLAGPAASAKTVPAAVPVLQESTARPATTAELRAAGVPADEVRGAGWKAKTVKLRWCWGEKKPKIGKVSGWRCNFLGVWTNFSFVYNGKKVYQRRVNCEDQGVYSVQWRWCGYGRNGKSWMSAGGNFKTRLGIGDANVSLAYWMRVYATSKGAVSAGGKRA